MMGVPPQGPPPSQAAAPPAPPRKLWKALLPLVLLVLPLGLYLAARYAPVAWQYWLMLAASVLAALVLGWTAVRVYLWGRERWQSRLQRAFQHRQDPYYVAGAKIEGRIKEVHRRLATGGMGPYQLPWFMIMGDSPEAAEAMLAGSGLVLPPQMDHGLNVTRDQIDRWRLANEAVFIDTTTSPPSHADRQWDILISRLAAVRPQEAISGVILMVDVEQLATEDKEARDRRHQATLARLRGLQAALRLSFPVYLVVTGLNRMPGFHEFFDGVGKEARQGMLGWSSSLGPEQEFEGQPFSAGLEQVKDSLNRLMLQRLSGAISPATADRIYIFNEEIGGLLEAASSEALGLFTPNLYLDPLPLRGLFLTAGLSEGPAVSFRGGGGLLAGQLGGHEGLDAGEGDAGWFVRDLFGKKILAEKGMVSRPRHARRRNVLIKSLAAALAVGAVAMGGLWVFNSVQEARTLVNTLEPALNSARITLENKRVAEKPLELCQMLLDSKEVVAKVAWWDRITRVGRYHDLEAKLGQIHRACFQDLFLRDYIRRVENALRYWDGEGDFLTFAQALAEYMRWTQAKGEDLGELSLGPLVEYVGSTQGDAQEIIVQYREMQKEGGLSDNLVDQEAPKLVIQVLERMANYLNPSPDGGGGAWQQQSQWWLDFSQGLREVARRYKAFVTLKPPAQAAPYQQSLSGYEYMVDSLSELLLAVENLGQLADAGSDHGTSWLHVDQAMKLLRQASRGWDSASRRVDSLSVESSSYKRRLSVSFNQDLYLVQLLGGRPSYAWLGEALSQAAPGNAQIVTDPMYQVGPSLLELLRDLGEYHSAIERWQNGYESWEQHVASSPRIGQQAELLRLEERHMDDALNQVALAQGEIKALTAKNVGSSPAGGGQSLTGLARKVMAKAQGSGGQEKEAETVRAGLLRLYAWGSLQKALPGWLAAMKRARLHQTAQYWQELAAKFVFAQHLTSVQSWADIKAQPVFSTGDPNTLVSAISEFANQWSQNVPPDFLAFTASGGKEPTPPELSQFLALNSALLQFNQRWLPPLRKAAQQFVGCVHDMDLSPAQAWSQIAATPGAGASGQSSISWGALQSFSAFRDSFEQANGPVLENITGTLVDIQYNVVDSLQAAVQGQFQNAWKGLLAKYEAQGFAASFPFVAKAQQAVTRSALDAFFADLDNLAASYSLEAQDKGKSSAAAPADAHASQITAAMRSGGRLRFIRQCQALAGFLAGAQAKEPLKVTVSLRTGEIGRSFHWVRLQFARGGSYDLSVYGQDTATIQISEVTGPMSFVGLDVARNPVTQTTPTTGDFALLQLPYALGSTKDPQRKKWELNASLPSVAKPGNNIPFQLELDFNQSLPELPTWPKSR